MSLDAFIEHLKYETKIPNVITYTMFMVVLTMLFALVLSRDMDEREQKEKGVDECFSEEQTKKLEEHNSSVASEESSEETSDEEEEEIQTTGLPDVYLLVRTNYKDAERLLASGGDVRFVSFGNTDVVIQKTNGKEVVVESEPDENSETVELEANSETVEPDAKSETVDDVSHSEQVAEVRPAELERRNSI